MTEAVQRRGAKPFYSIKLFPNCSCESLDMFLFKFNKGSGFKTGQMFTRHKLEINPKLVRDRITCKKRAVLKSFPDVILNIIRNIFPGFSSFYHRQDSWWWFLNPTLQSSWPSVLIKVNNESPRVYLPSPEEWVSCSSKQCSNRHNQISKCGFLLNRSPPTCNPRVLTQKA